MCVSILVVGIRITGRKVILNILEMWFVSVIRSQHEARNEATMRPRPSPLFRFCSFFPFCPFHPCLFLSSIVIFFLPLIVVFSVAVPFWNFFFHVFSSFPFSLASSFPLPFLFLSSSLPPQIIAFQLGGQENKLENKNWNQIPLFIIELNRLYFQSLFERWCILQTVSWAMFRF